MEARVHSKEVHMDFVLRKLSLGADFFSKYLSFPLPITIRRNAPSSSLISAVQ
jgi:hypothetical protein